MKYGANRQRARRFLFAAMLLVAFPLVAYAGPVVPDAGSILQQVHPAMPQIPSPNGTGLTIEQEGGKLPSSAPFEVKSIQILGNKLFDTATLHALVADAEGKTLTLPQLDELAARITDYYRNHGYPLTRAIIPAQTIQSGVVRIEIIEARYGKVRLDNHSQVSDPLLQSILTPLQSGQSIEQAGMDHALLLLTDVPGIGVNATLKPGEVVGTSDLLVETTPGPAVAGNMALDDYGNRYTGKVRFGGTMNFNNPLRHGDYLGLSVLTSGSGMNYECFTYDALLNGQGTRMGGSYSSLRYTLGDTLASLNGYGTAQVSSLWAKYPILRSQDANLYGKMEYDRMQLRDHIDTTGIQTDRHLGLWTASLAGDARDMLMSGGINTWSLGFTSGYLSFDNTAAQLSDASTAKTQDGFSKWNVSFSRLQNLNPKDALYLTLSVQGANGNLDSSEKMSVGGPYTVRAYDMGTVSGDAGHLLTAEFRHDLGQAWSGQWQSVVFVDSARITVNKNVWVEGANSATLTGAGAGFNWSGANQWSGRAYLATKIGSTPPVGATNSVRAWIEIGRGF